ncbi:hypothetical protein ACIA5A_18740 [Micromonospora sp. NPDC051300]|uniref:hypothetical protein n=1 Tax=Micromonospora sp. NPDC051300 TaxID=3364286 RepID=UPI0037A2ACE5
MALPPDEALLLSAWMIAVTSAATAGYVTVTHRHSPRPARALRVGRMAILVALVAFAAQIVWASLALLD